MWRPRRPFGAGLLHWASARAKQELLLRQQALHTGQRFFQQDTELLLGERKREEEPATQRPASPTVRPAKYWTPPQPQTPYIRFGNLESSVRHEIEHSLRERKFLLKSLPVFSRILNGLRPNELTIFTGPTGCGKTTVLSQMSLDYCMQGLTVLWGSFEIRNSRLAQVMLQQIAMKPLVDDQNVLETEAYNKASGKLRDCPMNFMNLFGSTGLDMVLGTMEMSMQQGPKPHLIILDNLQFMLSGQASNALDKWELMDRAVASLRMFCNTYNVHVVLVVHPRKEMDDTLLGISSVSGTAKATQEADNVIILQKIGDRRYLDVKKNRYYGDLGRVRLAFIPEARMVSEVIEEAHAVSGQKGGGEYAARGEDRLGETAATA